MQQLLSNWDLLLLAVIGGAVRVSTPFLFVSLGECLTEKAGRINLGLEGNLLLGAMAAYAVSFYSGSAWLGVAAAALVGACFGLLHGLLCSISKVNDTAIGISLIVLGTGIAFCVGKPFIDKTAPALPTMALGAWSSSPQVRAALEVNGLFIVGALLSACLYLFLTRTSWGLKVRAVGDSESAARALGFPVLGTRVLATATGGAIAGIGGSFLSLSYPGGWGEGLSSGQGIMAVVLVIFARWNPLRAFLAALLFGAAGALGPALQGVGVTSYYHLFNAAPYILTLVLMIGSGSGPGAAGSAPGELSLHR